MDLKDPISVRVQFVFNAGDPWSRLFDFERDISEFLAKKQMVGEVVNGINGQSGEMIIFVRQRKMEEIANQPQEQQAPSKQIKELKQNIK